MSRNQPLVPGRLILLRTCTGWRTDQVFGLAESRVVRINNPVAFSARDVLCLFHEVKHLLL